MSPHSVQKFFPASQFGRIKQLVPLTMGQSGASVSSVDTETGNYVLRVHGEEQESWERVALAQELASRHGIAPVVMAVHPVERATISVRVSGIPFGAAVSQPETRSAALKSLIEVLAKLHAIPPSQIADADPISFGQSVWDEQARREGFPAWALPLGNRIAACADILQRDHRKVFSHCDLHPANILWDGTRVWLVDWERGGLAHPYLDLATICNFLSLPDDLASSLLERQEQHAIQGNQTPIHCDSRPVPGRIRSGFLSADRGLSGGQVRWPRRHAGAE